MQAALGGASTNIRHAIERLGLRPKTFTITSEIKLDIYYHGKGFTKDDADELVQLLRLYKFQMKVLKHDFRINPDAIFIGCLVKSDIARLVLEKVKYNIKYIFRMNYPESEDGDCDGLKIGMGYSSSYNSNNRSKSCEPVKINSIQLQKLKNPSLSNTDFPVMLFKLLNMNQYKNEQLKLIKLGSPASRLDLLKDQPCMIFFMASSLYNSPNGILNLSTVSS